MLVFASIVFFYLVVEVHIKIYWASHWKAWSKHLESILPYSEVDTHLEIESILALIFCTKAGEGTRLFRTKLVIAKVDF